MKLLFDQNLSSKLVARLADLFPHSSQLRLLSLDRSDDKFVWEFAKANGFVVVTQDSDYADMSALLGFPPKVIWLRCGNQPTDYVEKLLRRHASDIASFYANADASCMEIF